jgi:hypothetical protein
VGFCIDVDFIIFKTCGARDVDFLVTFVIGNLIKIQF